MRSPRTPGWRSARGRSAAQSQIATINGFGPPVVAAPTTNGQAVAATYAPQRITWPWQGVQWNISYLGFLYYVWVIVTYHAPGAEVGMAIAIAGLLFHREKLILPPVLFGLGAFFLVALVGYLGTPYKPEVYLGVTTMGKIWLITLVGLNVLRTPQQVRFFIFFFLAAFALYPFRGAYFNIIFNITTWGRVAWNFIYENPNDLAAFSFLPLALAAGMLGTERRKWIRISLITAVVLIPLMMFFTQSRGALLALMITATVAFLGQKKRLRFLVGLGALAGVVAVAAPESVWDRMRGLRNVGTSAAELQQVDPEGSAMQRYELWKVAKQIFRENPIFGVGLGAYKPAHRFVSRQGQFAPFAWGARDTHSTYLNVLAETGIVGFIAYLSVFLVTVIRAESSRRRIRAINPARERQIFYLELGLLAFGLSSIFGTYVLIPFTYLFVITLYALAGVADQERRAAAWFAPRR